MSTTALPSFWLWCWCWQAVGCDRQLGSNAKEDNCGICAGDGSTCRLVRGQAKAHVSPEKSRLQIDTVIIYPWLFSACILTYVLQSVTFSLYTCLQFSKATYSKVCARLVYWNSMRDTTHKGIARKEFEICISCRAT